MTTTRWLALVLTTLVLTSACSRPVRVQSVAQPGDAVVVLLPESNGTVGRATVSNAAGKVELISARSSTVVSINRPPATVMVMTEGGVRRLFGEAFSALPPEPRHYTLFYRFDSEELTDGSKALVHEVLKTVKERRVADVVVLGHTDTMGTRKSNFALGLRRANSVRSLLIATGLSPSAIDVVSHGESELLIPTADGVVESRNRRVEITVR